MIVFKAFWKVVNKYKGTIIGYTVMLLIFGTLSMSSNDVTDDFKSSKPDVIIIDNDKSVLSNNLVKYFNDNANILNIDLEEEKIDDALFYRDANYVIYIDEGYEDEVLNGNNPLIKIKSSGDYSSSLAEMLLKRYLKTQRVLHDEFSDKNILVEKINNSLENSANVELATKINTSELSNMSRYYNFASYSIIAVVMFIICLVLSSFNEESVKKTGEGREINRHNFSLKDVDEAVKKLSQGALEHVTLYSIMQDPMTSCGCFECICGIEPFSNGVVIANREYAGMTPLGMTFSEMASMTGGGVQTPGFMGHGKHFIASKKFMKAEGGIERIVWMPKELKEQVAEKLNETAKELYGIDNFTDMIGDETIAEDPETLVAFLTEKGHPALGMDPMM